MVKKAGFILRVVAVSKISEKMSFNTLKSDQFHYLDSNSG